MYQPFPISCCVFTRTKPLKFSEESLVKISFPPLTHSGWWEVQDSCVAKVSISPSISKQLSFCLNVSSLLPFTFNLAVWSFLWRKVLTDLHKVWVFSLWISLIFRKVHILLQSCSQIAHPDRVPFHLLWNCLLWECGCVSCFLFLQHCGELVISVHLFACQFLFLMGLLLIVSKQPYLCILTVTCGEARTRKATPPHSSPLTSVSTHTVSTTTTPEINKLKNIHLFFPHPSRESLAQAPWSNWKAVSPGAIQNGNLHRLLAFFMA